jgi:3-polyprenyl-4-hydroxybenzoate decarboxylase
MHEPLTSLYAVIGIQFARGAPETEIWRALNGASTLHRFAGKWIVAVDEDIDPQNADALLWAMSYRCQPQHDLLVVPHKHPGHSPRADGETAAVLINATLKGTYAPVALPKREFMERARAISVSACRRLGRKAPGMATTSAIGRMNSNARRAWQRQAIILRSTARPAINGAAMSP